jgi:hypothetical protein
LRFTVIGWANRSVFDADFLVCDDAIGALTIGWQLAEDMKILPALSTLTRTHSILGQSLATYSYADEPAVIDMDNQKSLGWTPI